MFRAFPFFISLCFVCFFSSINGDKKLSDNANLSVGKSSHSGQKFANLFKPNKPRCTDKRMHDVDRLAVRLFGIGPNGRKFPDSISGMRLYCKETLRLTNEIESFTNECLKSEIASLVKVFIYSVRRTFARNYCGKHIRKSEKLFKISDCLNGNYFSQYRCFGALSAAISQLVNVPDDKIKSPHLCCNYVVFLNCQASIIDGTNCTRTHREVLLDFIRSGTTDLVDSSCGDYSESTDRCERLGPPPSAPNEKHYVSPFIALADMLVSMQSFKAKIPKSR